MTGRRRAYGYWHTERFFTHLANAGGAEALTNALGKWTATVWQSAGEHNVQRWAASAQVRCHHASVLYDRLWKQTKAYGDDPYRKLNAHQGDLAAQGVDYYERRAQIKEQKAVIDAELEQRWQRVWRAYSKSSKESEKQEHYAQEQCDLLRALEDLATTERTMYELDNRKDQVMTVCKLALANLVMWTRDHYFPSSYAHATWTRLAPFFHLRGVVV